MLRNLPFKYQFTDLKRLADSPVYSVSADMPGKKIVKASLFNTIPKERVEVNTQNKITYNNSD